MAIQIVAGVSGSGSVAIAAKGAVQQTLYTTPNVANTMYITTVMWGAVPTAVSLYPMVATFGYGAIYPTGIGSANGTGAPIIIRTGPNQAVIVTWVEILAVNTGTIHYSYNSVGLTIS